MIDIDGIAVFSATLARDREALGEKITSWIARHPNVAIVDRVVTQSSDREYHCVTITLFYKHRAPATMPREVSTPVASAEPTPRRRLPFKERRS